MHLKELQQHIDKLEKQNGWNNTPDESIVFLLEEMGEVAKWVRASRKRKLTGKEKEELNKEFADVLQHLLSLANTFHLDLEDGLQQKKGIPKQNE